jgi:hypothetical protein
VLRYIGLVNDPSKTNDLVMIVRIIHCMESAGRRVTVNGVRGSSSSTTSKLSRAARMTTVPPLIHLTVLPFDKVALAFM